MTPLRQWLKPPGKLLLILFLVTVASVSAVVWSGWRLLKQEGIVQAQHSRDRLEQSADHMAALVRGALAETADKLGAAEALTLSKGELALVLKEGGATVAAGGPLLYEPARPTELEANPNLFADAELLEFAQNQPASALEEYRRLASSTNTAIRASAVLREARVLRSLGRDEESRAAYVQLSQVHGVRIAGAPADLLARAALGDTSIKPDLLHGLWSLTRGQFQFYWSQVAGDQPPPAESVALAEAAALVYSQRQANPDTRGQQSIWIGSRPFVVLWRGPVDRRAVLIAPPDSFLRPATSDPGILYSAADSDGRIVFGSPEHAGRSSVVRAAAETGLPWTLYAISPWPPKKPALLAARSTFCSECLEWFSSCFWAGTSSGA